MSSRTNKPATRENVADALYILAQMAGTSGDWGPLGMNPDIKAKFERQAGCLISHADGTNFCEDFINLVDRDLGDVGE